MLASISHPTKRLQDLHECFSLVCVCVCLPLNSCGVHGEARPHSAAPGEPINYRAVTRGRPGPVIDASCAAGEALGHTAKSTGSPCIRAGRAVTGGAGRSDGGGGKALSLALAWRDQFLLRLLA